MNAPFKPRLLIVEDDEGLKGQLKWAYNDYEVWSPATAMPRGPDPRGGAAVLRWISACRPIRTADEGSQPSIPSWREAAEKVIVARPWCARRALRAVASGLMIITENSRLVSAGGSCAEPLAARAEERIAG